MVLPDSHGIPRVPWYLGYSYYTFAFSSTGLLPSVTSLSRPLRLKLPVLLLESRNPGRARTAGLGSPLFARRYWGVRFFFLFLRLLRCFSSPGALRLPMDSVNGDGGCLPAGLPHSDIHGSKPACSSPWLFAACRVLLRPFAPRHPPYALSNLTYCALITCVHGLLGRFHFVS